MEITVMLISLTAATACIALLAGTHSLAAPINLPDHELSNLSASSTSTKWQHVYACTECRAPVGHQEWMTKICLSCGQSMSAYPTSAAIREVVYNGRWVPDLLINGLHYERVNGVFCNISNERRYRDAESDCNAG